MDTETVEPDSPTLWLTKKYTYDLFGNKTTETVTGPDIQPRTSSTEYTPDGYFPQALTNAVGHRETRIHDPRFGATSSVTGPNGLTTEWGYDAFGRKLREARADGAATSWSYANCGAGCFKVTQSNTGSAPVTVYYDMLGRETRTETIGFGNKTVYKDTQYNDLGQVKGASKNYFAGASTKFWTCYPSTIPAFLDRQYSGLSTTSIMHNVANNTAKDQKKVESKNALGQVTYIVDSLLGEIYYHYDAFGNLIKTFLPRPAAAGTYITTTMSYDLRGRKTGMVDPDMGTWTYSYDTAGNLKSQKDAKGQVISMEYDLLNRLIKRTEPDDGVSTWVHDKSLNGIGKPSRVVNTTTGFTRSYQYDTLGRGIAINTRIFATDYNVNTAYDANSRVSTVTYPATGIGNRFAVRNVYDAYGYLQRVEDAANAAQFYWKANDVNADGKVINETLGNNLVTARAYDAEYGRLTGITTGVSGAVQSSQFVYDRIGNLEGRSWAVNGVTTGEKFTYDDLNRLKTATIVGGATKTYNYDAIGNIKAKSDFADNYIYGENGAGPHAVTSVQKGGTTFATYKYDANGNMTTGAGREVAYTSFNMPRAITQSGQYSTFHYSPDRARMVQTSAHGMSVYLDLSGTGSKYYEREYKGGAISHSHYIFAGGSTVAVYTKKSNSASATTRYFHKDHLGSIDAITNEAGTVVERLSYDPFGQRRQLNGQDGTIIGQTTHHGYTGHEHLDELGLIHMNGRIYDPALGRFMSADPNIADAVSTQGFNRYSYVDNNPLSATDPTGYFKWSKFRDKWLKPIVAVALAAYVGPWTYSAYMGSAISAAGGAMAITGAQFAAASASATIISGMASGFVGGAITGGNLKSAMQGAITGGIMSGAGYASQQSGLFGRTVARGVAGGVSSELQGGSFRNGFKLTALQNLANAGYKQLESLTDGYAKNAGTDDISDPVSHQRRTDGVIKCLGDCGNLVGFGAMAPQGTTSHWYDASGFGAVRVAVNAVSKVHDVFNSWGYGYDSNGTFGFLGRGTLYNTAVDVMWSMPGMPVAAVYTAISIDQSGVLLSDQTRKHR